MTPNATDSSGQASPGGRGTLAPVRAAIIAATGSVEVVHCGGLRRSKVGGPPQRSTTMVLHSGLFTESWGTQSLGGARRERSLPASRGTPSIGGQGRKRSLPGETPL